MVISFKELYGKMKEEDISELPEGVFMDDSFDDRIHKFARGEDDLINEMIMEQDLHQKML